MKSWLSTKNNELNEFKQKIRAVPELRSCLDTVKQKQGAYTSIGMSGECSPDLLYEEISNFAGNDKMIVLINILFCSHS
jgi:hypothetical protein